MEKRKKQLTDNNEQGSDSLTFEQSLEALDQIVAKLEGGQLSLEESMQLFEQGMRHAKRCEELLNQVEGKIQQLVELHNGTLEVEEFETDSSQDH